MNRKDTIVRALIAASGVIFCVSAVIREWKLTLVAIVPLLIAMVCGMFGTTSNTSEKRIKKLFDDDQETRS